MSSSESACPKEGSGQDVSAQSIENPEIEKAKGEVLKLVLKMKDAGLALEERRRQWRALLREWHPDKHDDKERATAVFQFLQKAKSMINLESE